MDSNVWYTSWNLSYPGCSHQLGRVSEVRDALQVSGACGTHRRHADGSDVGVSLDRLGQRLLVLAAATDSDFLETLPLASSYLSAAHRDIQRHVRTPISLSDASALSELLKSVGNLLSLENITTALSRPVSGQELVDTGYQLLDTVNEYVILAQHFYSKEAKAARAERPSDIVEAEISAVSGKASLLKASVVEYLMRVEKVLKSLR